MSVPESASSKCASVGDRPALRVWSRRTSDEANVAGFGGIADELSALWMTAGTTLGASRSVRTCANVIYHRQLIKLETRTSYQNLVFQFGHLVALSEPSKKREGNLGSRKQAEEAVHAKARQHFFLFWYSFFLQSLPVARPSLKLAM